MKKTIRIATRKSALAMAQAEAVRNLLLQVDAKLNVILVPLQTTGDRILNKPLKEVGGKGLFVKEIEEALLRNRADIAVHSLKDLPSVLPKGLKLAAFPAREDPRDVLVYPRGKKNSALKDLPKRARIGTSSVRRSALLKHFRPDIETILLRGNVDTRLRKIDGEIENLDAIVLASAGLKRLGLKERLGVALSEKEFIPAVGQGVIALESRANDTPIKNLLKKINHRPTEIAARCERAFLERLEADCSVPVGAHAKLESGKIAVCGFIAGESGVPFFSKSVSGFGKDAAKLGKSLAEALLKMGGDDVLRSLRAAGGLNGKRVLITRPETEVEEFRALLKMAGAEVMVYPAIEIKALTDGKSRKALISAVKNLAAYRWLVFTSANGADFFFDAWKNSKEKAWPSKLRIAAIGEKTKTQVESFGYNVDVCPEVYQAEGLAAALWDCDAAAIKTGARILIPRALEAREVLPEFLEAKGAQVEVLPIYEARPSRASFKKVRSAIEGKKIDVVTFTSSSTVNALFGKWPKKTVRQTFKDLTLACIGPITAETVRKWQLEPKIVATPYTIEALTKTLERYFTSEAKLKTA